MAEGILGLGQGQGSSLNQELLDKLKGAERKSTVEPIENSLEDITVESESISAIKTKANEFLETIKPFDLFITGNVNAFEEKKATTSGTSVVYDAVDVTQLNTGTINVNVTALAKNDAFQSDAVTEAVKDADIDAGTLEITLNGTLHSFDTTGETYDELVSDINNVTGLSASMEKVGDDSYRLVIKSSETGTDNALTFSGDAGSAAVALGFRMEDSGNPGTYIENAANHTQTASNMNATVSGVSYDVSSNTITVDGGLKISAVETGESSITLDKSTGDISTKLKEMVEKYNELVDLVDSELLSAESKVQDRSALRSMVAGIKDILFSTTGLSDDKNVFNYGLEVNSESGHLSINDEKLNTAISDDLEGLKELFIGVAEKEGVGTQLKTYVDQLDGFGGLLTTAEDNMNTRKESLEEEKEKAQEALDNKYAQMAQEFADYGVIINQMEASFSGLKLLIAQSSSG
jgi:flagellar hook-associated protein 2